MYAKIVVQRIATQGNILGASNSESWENYLSIWADLEFKDGTEILSTDAKHTAETIIFKTYYIPSITHKMRIYYNNKFYNILSIKEVGLKDSLEIKAESIL